MAVLPTTKKSPIVDLNNTSVLIHGVPKIGKTRWCASAPNVLALVCEPGGWDSVEAYRIEVLQWEQIQSIYAELKSFVDAKSTFPYGAICIDTIDMFRDMSENYVCRQNRVVHQADLAHGKGWSLVTTEFRRMLMDFARLPVPLFLISHSRVVPMETRVEKYSMNVPTLTDSPRRIVLGLVSTILYFELGYDKKTGKQVRIVRTKPNKYYEAGDRCGILPPSLHMNYESFADCFTNQTVKEKG